ncbi:MAG: hypothetical protein JSS43_05315 [Proteobacteria bacterium]|nr:hypothetical protein [Pseudomonadota bacterium]
MPDDPEFVPYLYEFHYDTHTMKPTMGRSMFLRRLDLPTDNPVLQAVQQRLDRAYALTEARRGETPYLVVKDFTAPDIISVFSLTTMRYFLPWSLSKHPCLP